MVKRHKLVRSWCFPEHSVSVLTKPNFKLRTALLLICVILNNSVLVCYSERRLHNISCSPSLEKCKVLLVGSFNFHIQLLRKVHASDPSMAVWSNGLVRTIYTVPWWLSQGYEKQRRKIQCEFKTCTENKKRFEFT